MSTASNIHGILLKYWGYASFRPLQEDIINSVLAGKDTLALLPTGGGKSICFQVPAMVMPGLCLVITPLIALMKDQVENLKKRGIKADALYSGQTAFEQDRVVNNAIFGDTKFLYLSPERLKSERFLQNIERFNVNMIAVDEAHCISQWGYDFRPPYLEIANIRSWLPKIPVLALTATATKDVVSDIQQKLLFKEDNVFKKSFYRPNLSYLVYNEDNKLGRLLRVAKNVQGTGIVYMRNRKATEEIARFLLQNGVSADYYHAGLNTPERDAKQLLWMSGKTKVIVATNAFGMGIDKPDVRFVIHLDIPENLESYFQEAGRGGRDGKPSYAVLLYNQQDIANLKERFEKSYPAPKIIKKVYADLCNFYNIVPGNGKGERYEFDVSSFPDYSPVIVYSSLKILESQGLLALSDDFDVPSKMMFREGREQLYDFQLRKPAFNALIQVLLRKYEGVFTNFVNIDEIKIAAALNSSKDSVTKALKYLKELEFIEYIPSPRRPTVTFISDGVEAGNVFCDDSYQIRKQCAKKKMDFALSYVMSTTKCRSSMLLQYFDEDNNSRCGHCDYCRRRNVLQLGQYEFESILKVIKPELQNRSLSIEEIYSLVPNIDQEKLIRQVRWLIDSGKISQNEDGTKYFWNKD